MKTYITNGIILTPTEMIDGSYITIEDGLISDINFQLPPLESNANIIDAERNFVTPGLIDIHFHGAMGKDTMDADLKSLQTMAQFCLEHGVTSFYPTTWSAAPEDIYSAIEAVKDYMRRQDCSQILGMHIEGPYLDLKYRGAQLPSLIRQPVRAEYQKWFDSGVVKLVTCAPEIPHGFEFISEAVQNSVKVSIGHTQASFDEVVKAANYGASQATHIFNGMLGLHHREPGTVGGVLFEKRITAQIICDGVHLHHAIVDLVINAKTPARSILITDSIRGNGLLDGDYNYKGQKFFVQNGVARTPEGGLSGSTLTLDQAIRNALHITGRPITEILPMATSSPARAMDLEGRKGVIQKGADADLVFFDNNFYVKKVFVKGECLHTKN